MTFFELLDICSNIVNIFFENIPDLLSIFVDDIGIVISRALLPIWNIDGLSFFEIIYGTIITELFDDISLLEVMFGYMLPFVLAFSFLKWLVSIVK